MSGCYRGGRRRPNTLLLGQVVSEIVDRCETSADAPAVANRAGKAAVRIERAMILCRGGCQRRATQEQARGRLTSGEDCRWRS